MCIKNLGSGVLSGKLRIPGMLRQQTVSQQELFVSKAICHEISISDFENGITKNYFEEFSQCQYR